MSDTEYLSSGELMREVGLTLAAVERSLILDTLTYCNGNRTHAARVLDISIRTLRNKLHQYVEEGISVPAPRGAADEASAAA